LVDLSADNKDIKRMCFNFSVENSNRQQTNKNINETQQHNKYRTTKMPSKSKKQQQNNSSNNSKNKDQAALGLEDRDELCRKIDEVFLRYIQTLNELSNSYALLTEKMKDVSLLEYLSLISSIFVVDLEC